MTGISYNCCSSRQALRLLQQFEMGQPILSLITYADLPELDPDDQLLKKSLERRGFLVKDIVWDQEVDWAGAGVCILRSTWDYHLKYEKFCDWLRYLSCRTLVINPPQLMLWNSRKTYLRDLLEAGLPVLPTIFLDLNEPSGLSEILLRSGWSEAVLKPSVGLASSGVKRVTVDALGIQAGEAHIRSMHTEHELMIQEYLPSVHDYGERALVFIDGKFSHCVRKSAFQKLAVAGAEGETSAEADQEEIEIGLQVLSCLDEKPLYARVDLLRTADNRPLLLELELIEPSLFFQSYPAAAELFADALERRLSQYL